MTLQEKVASIMSRIVALNNIDWSDLLQFAELIISGVKEDPEMAEMHSHAKSWLNCQKSVKEWKEGYDILMADKWVKYEIHGKGFIQRPALLEEVKEFMDIAEKSCISSEGRQLKSGVIMFVKKL